MNPNMMGMGMGGMPPVPQMAAPNEQPKKLSAREELNEYRKAFGLVRGDMKQELNPEMDVWGARLNVPEGKVSPAWGGRLALPEEMPDFRDSRIYGNPEIDQQNFEAYMYEHPFTQRYGERIRDLAYELQQMAHDPENPMSQQEAEQEFTVAFGKMLDEFENGDYEEPKKKGKK